MRNVYLFRALTLLTIMGFPVFTFSAGMQGHGRVGMNGQILASACSIHTDDVWQEVKFDMHSQQTVLNNGGLLEKPFSLRLVNCRLDNYDGEEWSSFAVTFDGEAVTGNSALFSVNGDARGVALKVMDSRGHTATPGVAMNSIPLNREDYQLDYRLQVVPSGEAFEEGTWSGAVRFMVTWQ